MSDFKIAILGWIFSMIFVYAVIFIMMCIASGGPTD